MAVEVEKIDGPDLVAAGDKVILVMVQPPEPDPYLVKDDQPRTDTLAMMTQVFDGECFSSLPGDCVVVVVAPELAFASHQLDALRSLVLNATSASRKVIMVAGFGMASTEALAEWQALGRHHGAEVVSPIDRGPLSPPGQPVNGAWIIAGGPNEPNVCAWVHVKTFAEQTHEKSQLNSVEGETVPIINLSRERAEGVGFLIAPLICSELIQDTSSGQSPHQFARQALIAGIRSMADGGQLRAGSRVLVVVPRWDAKPENPAWSSGIHAVLSDSKISPNIRVILANHAMPTDDNRRRGLCGVAARNPELAAPDDRKFTIQVHESNWQAQVLRTSNPGVARGEIHWGHNSGATQRDIWNVTDSWVWDHEKLQRRNPTDFIAVEIGRALTNRRCTPTRLHEDRARALGKEALHAKGTLGREWLTAVRSGLDEETASEATPTSLDLSDDSALIKAAWNTAALQRSSQGDPPQVYIEDRLVPVAPDRRYRRRRLILTKHHHAALLVWHSTRLAPVSMYKLLLGLLSCFGNEKPLIVAGGSNRQGNPRPTGVVSEAPPEIAPDTRPIYEGSITQPTATPGSITTPARPVMGWLSTDDLADGLDAATTEDDHDKVVSDLLHKALPPFEDEGSADG
jgi:hypothetical protein